MFSVAVSSPRVVVAEPTLQFSVVRAAREGGATPPTMLTPFSAFPSIVYAPVRRHVCLARQSVRPNCVCCCFTFRRCSGECSEDTHPPFDTGQQGQARPRTRRDPGRLMATTKPIVVGIAGGSGSGKT